MILSSKHIPRNGLDGHATRGDSFARDRAIVMGSRAALVATVAHAQIAPKEPTNRAPTSDDAAVGRRIKEERRAAGRTQLSIARCIGVTGAQFHRYEAGSSRVAASRLMAIAASLNIRPEVLMGVPVPRPVEAPSVPLSPGPTHDLVALVEVFASISDPRRRHALLAFARVISHDEQAASDVPRP